MTINRILEKISIPIAGLMLALGATGNLVESYGAPFKVFFGILSAFIFALLIVKVFKNSQELVETMNNPVIASVAPTFSMGIMILSTYIKPSFPSMAFGLWLIGILLHGMFIFYFTQKFVLHFDIKKVFPSYFVVYVGIVVGSVTAPAYGMTYLGQLLFWFGFICYLILLPIVVYRVFWIKSIPEPVLPTITIFAAPASLCLAGYMSSFQEKNMLLVWFLVLLSLVMLLSVLLYMPKMLKLKFYPSYSAFTFPCVISAIAIKKTNGFLLNMNQEIPHLSYIVQLEEVLAVSIVLYVLIRYIDFIFIPKPVVNKVSIDKQTL